MKYKDSTALVDDIIIQMRFDNKDYSFIANNIINEFRRYLTDIVDTLFQKGEKLLRADESLMFSGDGLHLSETYREEHVTGWLCWLLEMKILPVNLRSNIFNYLFNEVLNCKSYKKYSNAKVPVYSFSDVNKFRTEFRLEYFDSVEERSVSGKLDLLIESDKYFIAIENKIGDLALEKNCYYFDSLNKYCDKNEIITILLIPENDLEKFKENYKKKELKSNEILSAFPPVTWKEFLLALYDTIKHFDSEKIDNDKERWLAWRTLTMAFISFVEGNVLEYDIKGIRAALENQNTNGAFNIIFEMKEYMEYRRII